LHSLLLCAESNERPALYGIKRSEASIATGIEPLSTSTDIQAAYSLTNHIGIMTDLMFSNGGMFYEKNVAKLNHFNAAAGYYKPFNNIWVFEVYGGAGTSSQRHQYYTLDKYEGDSRLSFRRFFLQPSVGLTFKALDIALSTAISDIKFNKVEFSLSREDLDYQQLNNIRQSPHFTLLEPAITVRTGWKFVKFQLQYIYSYDLTDHNYQLFEESKFSLGLYFSLGKNILKNLFFRSEADSDSYIRLLACDRGKV
jgi:hypothetical protein